MTISRAQMYRQLYQMGGQGIMQLGNGQEEPIFPRLETLSENLGQAEQTLGTPSNDQFNMSSITTAITGRPQMNIGGRMGYQEGDMAMMQPEGIMNAMPQEAGGMQQGADQGQTALLTIIQLLIEQGVPPEQAQELALQILQVFAQGGQPAVEEFANQLEQEEQVQMMAGGGIAGYAQRQNYGFGSFVSSVAKGITGAVKGVASAVKSVAKSPIGQIALAIAAPYAISGLGALATGAGFTGLGGALSGFSTLGGSTFLGGALRAGLTNALIQGITTGKFNPKQALIAAIGGGIAGQVLPQGGAPTTSLDSGTISAGGVGVPGADILRSGVEQGLTPITSLPVDSSLAGQVLPGSMVYNPPTNAAGVFPSLGYEVSPTSPVVNVGTTQPNLFSSVQDFGTNLMKDPLKTIGTGIQSLYEKTKENIVPLGIGFTAGTAIRPQAADESDEDYQKYLANRNAEVARFEDLYRTGIRGVQAANGGRIGYEGGSMPMGEPRRNPAGIMELDYRAKGGFVPPIGIKEKADDIPAMLSNNEFVFTADAVRNAGGGNVNKGAQRMYGLMKQLEAGGVV